VLPELIIAIHHSQPGRSKGTKITHPENARSDAIESAESNPRLLGNGPPSPHPPVVTVFSFGLSKAEISRCELLQFYCNHRQKGEPTQPKPLHINE
jgi:hypothetical protein